MDIMGIILYIKKFGRAARGLLMSLKGLAKQGNSRLSYNMQQRAGRIWLPPRAGVHNMKMDSYMWGKSVKILSRGRGGGLPLLAGGKLFLSFLGHIKMYK